MEPKTVGTATFSRRFLICFSVLLCLIGLDPAAAAPRPPSYEAIAITIDLCPSSKTYEAKLFNYLDEYAHKMGQPVPVAIAVSGKWLLKHGQDLKQIKKLYLDITWVNHSYSHPFQGDFLNDPKIDFDFEVKETIKLMKRYGLKPSKYFRFPGLVHNKQRLAQLKKMGYVNLDADAWLGKGQKIRNGSIVLIHGNGNEAKGVVDKFIAYLKARGPRTRLVSLRQLVVQNSRQ